MARLPFGYGYAAATATPSTGAIAAGQTNLTGVVPIGSSANLVKNGVVMGLATVDASGNAAYTLPSALVAGDSVYFAFATKGTTPLAQIAGGGTVLAQIATACYAPDSGVTSNTFRSRSRHYNRSGQTLTSLVVGLCNFVDFYETASGGAVSFDVSIEYPAGTFSAISTKSVANGAIDFTSAISVPGGIPTDTIFFVNIKGTGTAKMPSTTAIKDTSRGEAYSNTATTAANAAFSADDGTGNMFYPIAILGQTAKASCLLIGDSRQESNFNSQDGSTDMGCTAKWVGPNFGYINLGIRSGTAAAYVANNTQRKKLAAYCSHGIIESGINDITVNNSTDAQLRSLISQIPTAYPGPQAWILQTMAPITNSTDGWATVANQSTGSGQAANLSISGNDPRKTNNAWRVSVPSGFVGCINSAIVLQANADGSHATTDTGIWYPGLVGGDGIHQSDAGDNAERDFALAPAKTMINGSFTAPSGTGSAAAPTTANAPGSAGGTSTTALTSSASTVSSGASITLTATVASSAGTPTGGTVTFYDGSTALGTATLTNGVATGTTTALTSQGSHTLTAAWAGNAAFGGSTSPSVTVTVSAAGSWTPSRITSASILWMYDFTDPSARTVTGGTTTGGIAGVGGSVTAHNDASSAGLGLVSDASYYPTLDANVFGSLSAPHLNTQQARLRTSSTTFAQAQPFAMFNVFKTDASDGSYALLFNGSTTQDNNGTTAGGFQFYADNGSGGPTYYAGGNVAQANGGKTLSVSTIHGLYSLVNNASSTLGLDGVTPAVIPNAIGTGAINNGFSFGAINGSGGTSVQGWLGYSIGLSGDLSTSDRQKLEGWAYHKFGGSLPTSHPYYNSAP